MSRGDKSKITDKLERKTDHVGEGYQMKSLPDNKRDRRVWSTDNNEGGGQKPGSGAASLTGAPAPLMGVPLTRNAQAGERKL